MNRDGQVDPRVLHAGLPVTEGQKWGMNVWIRERPLPLAASGAEPLGNLAIEGSFDVSRA
jgi:hypothetical protein